MPGNVVTGADMLSKILVEEAVLGGRKLEMHQAQELLRIVIEWWSEKLTWPVTQLKRLSWRGAGRKAEPPPPHRARDPGV
jgi:hypothetical protein